MPREEQVVLTVNGQEWIGLMCTPTLLEELAVGFLYNEGFIDGMQEVADVRVCGSGRCVDVWLHKDVALPSLHTITSGCSGGTTFEVLAEARHPVISDLQIAPGQVQVLMRRLQAAASLYRQAQGIHASALAEGTNLCCVAEDVGRHNTVDKLAGLCLRQNHRLHDHVLVTSGRVSSEMLAKANRMGIPVIVSRTAPTSLSVDLARVWGVTLIGYARGRGFRVYTGQQRLVGWREAPAAEPTADEGRR